MPVTDNNKKVIRVLCIHYLIWSQEEQVKALLDSGSKINVINPNYARKLGLKIQKTNIEAQKIDGSTFEIFEIVIADFQAKDKVNKSRFFQETFLVVDTKFEIILVMLFLKISNADISFDKRTFT